MKSFLSISPPNCFRSVTCDWGRLGVYFTGKGQSELQELNVNSWAFRPRPLSHRPLVTTKKKRIQSRHKAATNRAIFSPRLSNFQFILLDF